MQLAFFWLAGRWRGSTAAHHNRARAGPLPGDSGGGCGISAAAAASLELYLPGHE